MRSAWLLVAAGCWAACAAAGARPRAPAPQDAAAPSEVAPLPEPDSSSRGTLAFDEDAGVGAGGNLTPFATVVDQPNAESMARELVSALGADYVELVVPWSSARVGLRCRNSVDKLACHRRYLSVSVPPLQYNGHAQLNRPETEQPPYLMIERSGEFTVATKPTELGTIDSLTKALLAATMAGYAPWAAFERRGHHVFGSTGEAAGSDWRLTVREPHYWQNQRIGHAWSLHVLRIQRDGTIVVERTVTVTGMTNEY